MVARRVLRAVAMSALLAVPAVAAAAVAYTAGPGIGLLTGFACLLAALALAGLYLGSLRRSLAAPLLCALALTAVAPAIGQLAGLRAHGERLDARIVLVRTVHQRTTTTYYTLLAADLRQLPRELAVGGRPEYAAGDRLSVLVDPDNRIGPVLATQAGGARWTVIAAVCAAALLGSTYLAARDPWASGQRLRRFL